MEFLGIGPLELLVVMVIALIVLGPSRMAEAGRKLGEMVRELRRASAQLPRLDELLEPGEEEEGEGPAPGPQGRRRGRRDGE